jgi:3'-phosphoadenosine 5'-phosphosulfate sulfotransferase (PAPS reductase)/FAD synthetase
MGGGNLTAVFCDTGWEHPDTYKHVNDVCLQMGVRLITLKSKYDFVSLAVHKKRFPSTNARFCTSELKMKPMIDYVLSLKESCIIIQGIRAGESTARAAMEEECMYFKSYFQPNKKGRTENYRSKDVKEWCSQFDASVLRPIFKWSAQQVIDCILDAGQKPNPLYYRGFSRVGCFPCIMCRHKEIELIAKNRTEMKKILIICVLFALIAGCASPRNSVKEGARWQTKQLPWVSVKERLPDENEDIIILCKHGAIFNGTYSNNVWFCMDGYIYDTYKGNPIYSSMSSIPPSWEPIAWMPKPKFEE